VEERFMVGEHGGEERVLEVKRDCRKGDEGGVEVRPTREYWERVGMVVGTIVGRRVRVLVWVREGG